MWPSFLSSFLAGLATSICSEESKGKTEACTDLVWSEKKNPRGPAHISLLVVFLYSRRLSACERREQQPQTLPWALQVPFLGFTSLPGERVHNHMHEAVKRLRWGPQYPVQRQGFSK